MTGSASGQGPLQQRMDLDASEPMITPRAGLGEPNQERIDADAKRHGWAYPEEGMHVRVLISAKTNGSTRIVDDAIMWMAPHTTFGDTHGNARRLFHVSDSIPTTASWEVHGDNPNPYKSWAIGQGDEMQARQLPTMFSKQDKAGLVLHLRCDYTKDKTSPSQLGDGFAMIDTQLVLMGVLAGQMTMRLHIDDTTDKLHQEVRGLHQLSDNIQFTLELNGPQMHRPHRIEEDSTTTVRNLPGFDATQYRQPFRLLVRCVTSKPPHSETTQVTAGLDQARGRSTMPLQENRDQAAPFPAA